MKSEYVFEIIKNVNTKSTKRYQPSKLYYNLSFKFIFLLLLSNKKTGFGHRCVSIMFFTS